MEQVLQDPRTALLSAIDIEACKVELSNTPIVLLCGGPVVIKERPDDPQPAIASLRHAVTDANTSYEIFRPEEIASWLSDGVFKNLMNLEADLASICSLVVIILESAGSLAELGAFSQLPDLSKKIIAIRSNDFRDAPSFINLGILRHLTESEISSVKSYPWDVENPATISSEVVNDVILDIQDRLDQLTKSSKLKLTNSSHVVVLICEIIELFSALKENEIFDYLIQVGVAITKEELKRKLFLLKEFRLVKNEIYGDATFFMRSHESYHRLRMALKEGSNKDALRISAECLEYYNVEPKQRHRKRAIAQARQGASK
ncbi:MAG: retron St85 family effector protein [Pseudomonadota bacterium]